MRAKKRDANHAHIRDGLRKAGVYVVDTGGVGDGFPDLMVWRNGWHLLEVKDPAQPPSARRLTEDEAAFARHCPGPVHVVLTLEEALAAVGLEVAA